MGGCREAALLPPPPFSPYVPHSFSSPLSTPLPLLHPGPPRHSRHPRCPRCPAPPRLPGGGLVPPSGWGKGAPTAPLKCPPLSPTSSSSPSFPSPSLPIGPLGNHPTVPWVHLVIPIPQHRHLADGPPVAPPTPKGHTGRPPDPAHSHRGPAPYTPRGRPRVGGGLGLGLGLGIGLGLRVGCCGGGGRGRVGNNRPLTTSMAGLRDGPPTHPLRSNLAYFDAFMGEIHAPQGTVRQSLPHEACPRAP